MRFVFVDVGTHNGQTLKEVTRARWRFDQILALEPMPPQFQTASARFGGMKNVNLFNFGLADKSGPVQMYGDNSDMGASIFENKQRATNNRAVTECQMIEASAFFRQFIKPDDVVLMKLNCEGAEVPILKNLIATGEINKINHVVIDFDIRKVTGQEGQDTDLIEQFELVGFENFALAEDVMHGKTHEMRIATWLKSTGALPQTPFFFLGDICNWGDYVLGRIDAGIRERKRISLGRTT